MKPWWRARRVLEEYEARLTPGAVGSGGRGKAERKRYATGEQRLRVRGSGLGLADGSRVEIQIAGRHVASAVISRGRFGVDLETPAAYVMAVRAGEVVEVFADGTVVLRGELAAE